MRLVPFTLLRRFAVHRKPCCRADAIDRNRNSWLVAFLGAFLGLLPAVLPASPGYTYEEIYSNLQYPAEALQNAVAINNRSQVVFTIRSGTNTYSVYIAVPGQAPQLVFEGNGYTGQVPGPEYNTSGPIGLNDDGIVAVPLYWNEFDDAGNMIAQDSGFGLFQPGVAEPIREIRKLDNSSGRLNDSLQMGGRGNAGGWRLVITDGITTSSSSSRFPQGEVQVNNAGTVATITCSTENCNDAQSQRQVVWATPPGTTQGTNLGELFGLGYSGTSRVPGLNDHGWLSFATEDNGGGINPDPRVFLISPTGTQFVVAETDGADFVNFRQPRATQAPGVSLNNFNRISFVAQRADNTDAIWVNDASGAAPRLAVDGAVPIEFTSGRSFVTTSYFANDVSNHATNSMNDKGEIAVMGFGSLSDASGVQIRSSTQSLFVAIPAAGTEPGSPVLPDPADALPQPEQGWRLRWPGFASLPVSNGSSVPARFGFFDPPIAIGYDFAIDAAATGAFTWVLIPAALPGGDSEFTIEVDGSSAPLVAGTAFDLSTIATGPVGAFRITDIDTAEAVDPTDPVAFVTGLNFAAGTDEDVSFTMTPVVFEAPDTDGDGLVDDFEDANPPLDRLDPDSDDDGIGDALDTQLKNPANFCSELGPDNVTLQQVVTGDLTCAARQSIGVVPPSEVSGAGHLRLIAPSLTFQSGLEVDGRLSVISADPCPACSTD